MKSTKLLVYVAIWILLGIVLNQFLPSLPQLLEPRSALFVFGLPWLVCCAGHGIREVSDCIRAALTQNAADLDLSARLRSAGLLYKLGGLSLSAGVLAFFASAVAALNSIASTGGQANAIEMVAVAPAALLAPLFGFLLSAFVYGPLASSVEGLDSGLGAELDA